MKRLSMLGVIIWGMCLGACGGGGDDEGKLTGVNWYYNGTRENNRLSYADENVLEVTRFENNGDIRGVEFAGRIDTVAGSWREAGTDVLSLEWKNGNKEKWNVLHCSSSQLKVNNGWGDRTYDIELSYLEDLTGDTFWINYFDGDTDKNASRTRLGFKISGNKNLRSVYALLSDDKDGQIELKGEKNIWTEGNAVVPYDGEARRVRFSCRVGAKNYVKFDEYVSGENFSPMTLTDIGMQMKKFTSEGRYEISWNEFAGDDVCYRLEVYEASDITNIYFASSLFTYPDKYTLSKYTNGTINRLSEIEGSGKNFKIRLTAIMLEKGVLPNSVFAENNFQAVVYVTDTFSL